MIFMKMMSQRSTTLTKAKTLVYLLQMKVLFFQLSDVKTFATLFSLMTIEYKRHVIKAHVSNIK